MAITVCEIWHATCKHHATPWFDHEASGFIPYSTRIRIFFDKWPGCKVGSIRLTVLKSIDRLHLPPKKCARNPFKHRAQLQLLFRLLVVWCRCAHCACTGYLDLSFSLWLAFKKIIEKSYHKLCICSLCRWKFLQRQHHVRAMWPTRQPAFLPHQ